jgi:YegS/Rv2252/BmrU family lipid kinase
VNGPGPGPAGGVGGRAALLVNAQARLGARAEAAAAEALRHEGITLARAARVRRPTQLRRAVDALLDADVDRLIVGGGDGTLGTVAARLAGTGVALGVIPLGTANDFARALGIPADLERAAAVAAGGHARPIDLATANGEPFLNVASVGLSAATARLSTGMKRWLGPAAYALAGAVALARPPTFTARVETPGGTVEQRVHQLVVGNGRFFGGGVLVAEGSTLDDGSLVVYTLGARGRWPLLRTIALLRLQVPLDRPGDAFVRAPEVHVATEPPGLPVNLDGEIRTTTPVRFAVSPGALRVLTAGS